MKLLYWRKIEYNKNYKNISWSNIISKIEDKTLKEYKDIRAKSIEISLAALINFPIHIFGIKIKEF